MNADGTDRTALTDTTYYLSSPEWSPDGSKIVYTNSSDGDPELYIMNADGTDQLQLTDDTDRTGNPVWSPAL